jgi:hypothetical protein
LKSSYDNRRPDIILHKRGIDRSNYLVIEMKHDGSARDISDDMRKIKTQWFRGHLRYSFGAVVNLRSSRKCAVRVIKNESVSGPRSNLE